MMKRSTRNAGRVIKLLRNGHHQTVRIPKELELPGAEVLVTRDGNRLILEPVTKKDFIAALRALGPLPPGDRFPAIGDPTPEPMVPSYSEPSYALDRQYALPRTIRRRPAGGRTDHH